MKRLRDPIYGYLEIPKNLMKGIIDTAVFQRLRRIAQTSYAPLFPSALHNRFIHSLGVYHLGTLAVSSLIDSLKEYLNLHNNGNTGNLGCLKNLDRLREVFLLACLLHDVGHAPFSHTGESFFLENSSTTSKFGKLHHALVSVVNGKDESGLQEDIPSDTKAAAPHELMSAIVGLKSFPDYFKSVDEREFFARCITGYRYKLNGENAEHYSILNCFISLLNSKVIDVDRLDYLIRDAFFTGFDTVNIDYQRLLSSLTVVRELHEPESGAPFYAYDLAYYKGSISVIESVVFAHDAERKWIQTHPAVLYEIYILQHIMEQLDAEYRKKGIELFSENALSESGCPLDRENRISLLCDDDIISLMKRKKYDALSKEYFNRNCRPHPLWKSEAEYRDLEKQYASSDGAKTLEKALAETENYVRTKSADWTISDQIIENLNKEIEAKLSEPISALEAEREAKKETNRRIIRLMSCIQKCFHEQEIPCNCIILKASRFFSGFDRPDFAQINTLFPPSDKPRKFTDVVSSLSGIGQGSKNYFYLFFYLPESTENKKADPNKLKQTICKAIFSEFGK